MQQFLPGDLVRCVRPGIAEVPRYLTLTGGRVYEVDDVSDDRLRVSGMPAYWSADRFDLVYRPPAFHVGDRVTPIEELAPSDGRSRWLPGRTKLTIAAIEDDLCSRRPESRLLRFEEYRGLGKSFRARLFRLLLEDPEPPQSRDAERHGQMVWVRAKLLDDASLTGGIGIEIATTTHAQPTRCRTHVDEILAADRQRLGL